MKFLKSVVLAVAVFSAPFALSSEQKSVNSMCETGNDFIEYFVEEQLLTEDQAKEMWSMFEGEARIQLLQLRMPQDGIAIEALAQVACVSTVIRML